ncbi:MAG: hypothetical protein WCW64_00730 [Phycisphaerae bacterium]|jgi:hypothetical protein
MTEQIPKGELNLVHLEERDDRFFKCEFCEKAHERYNDQKIPICNEHKDTMMVLKCPICNEDLSVQWSAGEVVYWCLKHHEFFANDLRKDSKFDKDDNIKAYWKKELVQKRLAKAKTDADSKYGKPMPPTHKAEKDDYLKAKEIWLNELIEAKSKKLT